MLCFNKLTGECNNKKYFKTFLICGSIALRITNLKCAFQPGKIVTKNASVYLN